MGSAGLQDWEERDEYRISTIKKPPGGIPVGGFDSFPGSSPGVVRRNQAFATFEACGPLGPWVISNWTLSPSARLLKPSDLMALK